MFNDKLMIKLLIKEIKQDKVLYKSFNGTYKTQKYKLTDILPSILYVLKTGISWRSLNDPLIFTKTKHMIHWNTIYKIYIKLNNNEIFKITYMELLKKYIMKSTNKKLKIIITDTTFIPNKNGKDNMGYNKFYNKKKGTKISIITDSFGIPFNIKAYKGNKNDTIILEDQLKDKNMIDENLINKHKCYFMADKGYDSYKLCNYLKCANYVPLIPQRKNVKDETKKRLYSLNQRKLFKNRMKIECMFNKMKRFRRLSFRYDSKLSTFMGFIYLAFIAIIIA